MTEAEIIAGLTDAQKAALIRHKRTQWWGGRTVDTHLPNWSDLGVPLKGAGLIRFCSETSGATELTPLGLAVRQVLQERGG